MSNSFLETIKSSLASAKIEGEKVKDHVQDNPLPYAGAGASTAVGGISGGIMYNKKMKSEAIANSLYANADSLDVNKVMFDPDFDDYVRALQGVDDNTTDILDLKVERALASPLPPDLNLEQRTALMGKLENSINAQGLTVINKPKEGLPGLLHVVEDHKEYLSDIDRYLKENTSRMKTLKAVGKGAGIAAAGTAAIALTNKGFDYLRDFVQDDIKEASPAEELLLKEASVKDINAMSPAEILNNIE